MPLQDVSFSDKGIYAFLLFYESGIYPMLHIGVGSSVGMVELLVAKVKLLYPPLAPLFNAISGEFIGHKVIDEAIYLVAEGKSIIIEAEHHAHLGSCGVGIRVGILIGAIATLAALACEHSVVGVK
jgi:hypothetical protein